MEKNKEFEVLFNELQNNTDSQELTELAQKAREETKKANKLALIICGIIDIVVIVFCALTSQIKMTGYMELFVIFTALMQILVPVLMVNVFVFIICHVANSKNNRAYSKKFKEIGVSALINNFYDEANYKPDVCLPESVYREANYREGYDRYHGDDYLEAKIDDKYQITMGNLDIEREEEETDSDGKKTTHYVTVFCGLFFKVEIDKSIGTEVRIMQNGAGVFNKRRLKMDSSEFEKAFDVITDNQIVGMQLLTPDIMERLLDFKKRLKIPFDVVIMDNNLYFRFMCGPIFEVKKSKKGAYDEKSMKKYYDMLKFTTDISRGFFNLIHDTEV